jgi:hypothetical protein
MSETSKDAGVIQALVERLEKQRLPWALAIKEKVDAGEVLGDADIAFLEEVFKDAKGLGALLDRHPELQDLAARMINLYEGITAKALENEKASSSGPAE